MLQNESIGTNLATPDKVDFLVSASVFNWMCIVSIGMSVFGMVTNSLNLAVFARLGTKESINISLIGLSVADFGLCFTGMLRTVTLVTVIHVFLRDTLNIDTQEASFMLFIYPRTFCSKITIALTATIAFERCFCVTLPLKVKYIITSGRVKATVLFCYLTGVFSLCLDYSVNRLVWKFYPDLNRTLLGYSPTKHYARVYSWRTPMETLFFYVLLLSAITISTGLLVRNLKKTMSWRHNAAKTSSNDTTFKERRLVRMVATISSLFLLCYLPNAFLFLVSSYNDEYRMNGKHANTLEVIGYFTFFTETFNSSINIFVYYRYSTSFKNMFDKMFREIQQLKRKEKQQQQQ